MDKEENPQQKEILIVLVESDPHHRKKMKEILNECFPNCAVKSISHGIEAMNFLLTPVNKYDLVILDGKLANYPSTLITKVNGPDIAAALKEHHINTPIILWTNNPSMLAKFDEVFGQRLPEIEKPCRKSNVAVILAPIINSILLNHGKTQIPSEEQSPYNRIL